MKKILSLLLVVFMVVCVMASCGGKNKTEDIIECGSYKVGDYYNDGTKEGIVFVVYDGGYHGKIVSLDEGKEKWAEYAVWQNATHATSDGGGMGNMNKIKKLPNWKSNYPAFAWCASLGEGWYLPAVDELKLIYQNKSIINRRLNERGYGEFADYCYWSSTEGVDYSDCAWNVYMDGGLTFSVNKDNDRCVRAVSAF